MYTRLAITYYKDRFWQYNKQTKNEFIELIKTLLAKNASPVDVQDRVSLILKIII